MASNANFTACGSVMASDGTDAYGIPNVWKMQNFGSTNGPLTGAMEDWDGDGMNNLGEYLAGTSPTNAASVLKIDIPLSSLAPGDFVIVWLSVSGKYYRIESGTNLTQGFGDLIRTNVFATPPTNSAAITVDQAETRFYRVGLER
jgi:hypothetical protein